MWREFKPALVFLSRFLAIYFVGNVVYGLYVESFETRADAITELATRHTSIFLNACGVENEVRLNTEEPTVLIRANGLDVISVYEGCNGVNVMIIFVAFIVAFGGSRGLMLLFIPAGLLLIHAANLARLALLFQTMINFEEYFYFFHKYIFTATLYVFVLILWAVWVFYFNERRKKA